MTRWTPGASRVVLAPRLRKPGFCERGDVSRSDAFENGFRKVFEERYSSIFRYLNRMSGDPAQAADIAQEVFVRLYERGKLPEDARAWLVTVANNLFRDEYRRSIRQRNLLEAKRERLYAPDSPLDPEEAMERRERRQRVRTALETLPVRDQQALLLRHEGYSYREIADVLKYGETGIGKLILRASRAFREAFEELADA